MSPFIMSQGMSLEVHIALPHLSQAAAALLSICNSLYHVNGCGFCVMWDGGSGQLGMSKFVTRVAVGQV